MRKTEIMAYAAGVVDGEGNIGIGKREDTKGGTFRLYVAVTNTNEWICQWLRMQFGGRVRTMKSAKSNWKIPYRWVIESRAAMLFLEQLLPYLNLKRPQAELAIKFQRRRMWSNQYKDNHDTVLDEAEKVLMSHFNKRGI